QVNWRTMDPEQLLQVRTFDIEGERVGSLTAFLPEGAPAGAIEAAVIEQGGLLGLFDTEVAIPLSRIAVLADADGNGLRVIVTATAAEISELPEAPGR
ncbi:MAG: hypothetical protein ACU0BS_11745, partial [Hasllibacter sp.]